MFKEIRWVITLLCGLLINFSVFAGEGGQKIEPPYPEVWGYDLAKTYGIEEPYVEGYLMDDGDVWFIISRADDAVFEKDISGSRTDIKYILIKFFSGEKILFSEKERPEIYKTINKKHVLFQNCYGDDLYFKDGSKLQFSNYMSKCFYPEYYKQYFLKTESNGLEKKYLVLRIRPEVEVFKTWKRGEEPVGTYYYDKLQVLRKVVPLKDDTFIVFEDDSNLILRFDKNFNTKFKPLTAFKLGNDFIMRNFFVIDYSLIENIKSTAPFYQVMHDALLAHFFNKYSK